MSALTRTVSLLSPAGVLCVLMSTSALALEGNWQVGLNTGLSVVSPDTDGSGFTLDNDQSTAIGAYVGLDLTPQISAEIAITDLGEAELSQDQSISYQAISIGATAYVWGEKAARDRSEGVSGYLRLGLSSIDNESDISLNESNNTALWLGAGVQYPVAQNWGLRAELASFDGDAQAIMAGVFWRSGNRSARNQSGVSSTVPQTRLETPTPVTPAPAPEAGSSPGAVATPAPTAQPAPAPRIETGVAQVCPPGASAKIPDAGHCANLNSVVAGLNFIGNTAEIDPASNAALAPIVSALLASPNAGVEIRAHVQSSGNAQAEAALSAQRARSVARYLVQNGVPVSQLGAKAFGATQPLRDENTVTGRKLNNRIELRSF